jgi:MFS family permease
VADVVGLRRSRGPLRDRNFLIYALGNTVSWLGTWAQRIGIGWLSWDLTHRTAWVGAISLAQLLPLVLFGPLFGALLDRHDHRRYALSVNLALAALAALLYVLTAARMMSIGLLCVMAVLGGIANSAYHAARLAMVNDVVGPDQLSRAIAINSVLYNLTRLVGPAIAGIIIAHQSIAAVFAVNAVSFIGILGALLVVRLTPRPRGAVHGLLAESRDGLRYVIAHAGLRQLMLLSAITSLLGRGVYELLPAFADLTFKRGSLGLANLTSAAGLGAMVGALLLSQADSGPRLVRMTWCAALSLGAAVALFGMCVSFRAGLLMATVIGFVSVLSSVGLQVLLQSAVDDRFRGRVVGLWSAVTVAGPGVGSALGGSLAQLFGLKSVAVAAGILCFALVGWVTAGSPNGILERRTSI